MTDLDHSNDTDSGLSPAAGAPPARWVPPVTRPAVSGPGDDATVTSRSWKQIRASLSRPELSLESLVDDELTVAGPMLAELRQIVAEVKQGETPTGHSPTGLSPTGLSPTGLSPTGPSPTLHSPAAAIPPPADDDVVADGPVSDWGDPGVLWSTTPPLFDVSLFGVPRFRGVRLPAELSTDIVVWLAFNAGERLSTKDAVDAIWAGHASAAAVRAALDRVNSHHLIEPLLDDGEPLVVRDRSAVSLNVHYRSDWSIVASLLAVPELDRLAGAGQVELLGRRFDSVLQLALAGAPLDHCLRNETAGGWDQMARNHMNRHLTVAAAHWIGLLHAQGSPERARQLVADLTTANPGLHLA